MAIAPTPASPWFPHSHATRRDVKGLAQLMLLAGLSPEVRLDDPVIRLDRNARRGTNHADRRSRLRNR